MGRGAARAMLLRVARPSCQQQAAARRQSQASALRARARAAGAASPAAAAGGASARPGDEFFTADPASASLGGAPAVLAERPHPKAPRAFAAKNLCQAPAPLIARCAAEAFGAAVIVGGGCGAVALGAPQWGVAAAFGLSVWLGVLLTKGASGAHLNPAVTAMMLWLVRTRARCTHNSCAWAWGQRSGAEGRLGAFGQSSRSQHACHATTETPTSDFRQSANFLLAGVGHSDRGA